VISIINTDEIWKPIILRGLETFYIVSNKGRVMNTKTHLILKPCKEIKKRKTKKDDWYLWVRIYLPNKSKKESINAKIHRLVAEAFIPNPDNKPMVNHIDGDKTNNCVENLEWVTASENAQHSHDNELQKAIKGEDHYNCIISDDDVHKICRLLCDGVGCTEIASMFGVTKELIFMYKTGRSRVDITSQYPDMPKVKPRSVIPEEVHKKVSKMILSGLSNKDIRKRMGIKNSTSFNNFLHRKRQKMKELGLLN
jgi:DNA-binding CsgD family transcriptional regulator